MQLFVFIFVAFVAGHWNNVNAEESICRRTTGDPVISLCNLDEQDVASLCYPNCQSGYENIGPNICRKLGCAGLGGPDSGVSCEKPPGYGRGAGYVITEEHTCIRNENGPCETWGALWYPKCRSGYSPFGCCICSPICPEDYIDRGALCEKPSYGRGVGVSRLGCSSGLQYDAGLCYTPCSSDRNGVGPLCWGRCGGENSVECGIFCTSSERKCADITFEIVGSALKVAANIAGTNVLGTIVAIFDGVNQILEPASC